MALEITIPATSLSYEDNENSEMEFEALEVQATVASKKFIRHKQNIGTSEEAIVLGEVTTPGWALFVNKDLTNYIKLLVGTGGAEFARLLPGESARLRLGAGAQVPYGQANGSACQLDYLIINT